MKYPPDEFFTVYEGDARYTDRYLANVSSPAAPLITCTITSPPYGNLKDYGGLPDQIGHGQPYDEYLTDLRRVFRSIHQHTRTDGSMWIIADTLRPNDSTRDVRRLEPLPFQLAAEAEDVGWALRDVLIWQKDKTLPWSGRGRLRNAFEYILFFVKTGDFKYHVDRLRDSEQLEEWWVKWPERYNPLGKVPSNVWEFPIPVQGTWGAPSVAHACPLPPDLVERLILLSTDPGDVVFDPFSGIGTVVGEAERLGRRGLGIELNAEYVAAFKKTMRNEFLARRDHIAEQAATNEWVRDTIINLRALKYPKVLMKQVSKDRTVPTPLAAISITKPTKALPLLGEHEVIAPITVFVVEGDEHDREQYRIAAKDAAENPPASKMGVGGEIVVVAPDEVPGLVPRKTLYHYQGGRTWWAESTRIKVADLTGLSAEDDAANRPIFADVKLQEEPRALGT